MKKDLIDSLNKAWLARWGFHSQSEDEALEKYGIYHKIVDIISVRRKFDKHIVEIARNIYRQRILYPSEQIHLADYNNGRKREKKFFGSNIPYYTHLDTDLYRNLIQSRRSEGLRSKRTQALLNQWKQHPEYVIVGHNPYLEIRKVYNLAVYRDENDNEILEWDWPLPNGDKKHEQYRARK